MPDPALRLNMLLEATAAWGQCASYDALLAELPRLKWILDFERGTVLLRGTAHATARAFAIAPNSAHEVGWDTLSERDARILTAVLRDGHLRVDRDERTHAIGHPLESGSTLLGAVCFTSVQGGYEYHDLRFAQFIAQALAGILDRLAAREDERREAAGSRRKDEFIAMLGHELRNPLAPMVTALELMKLRGFGQGLREVAVLERQVSHMKRLVDDVMDMSRIERGRVVLNRRSIDVAHVISDAIDISGPLFEARKHRAIVDVPVHTWFVDGDPVRLTQILTNLLTNAAKYSNPDRPITISARHHDGLVHIGVKDEGIGIAPELQSQLFEPFVQGRRGLDRAGGGLGLGLSIARALATRHGGSLSVTSDGDGTGSEFVLTLPTIEPRADSELALELPSEAFRACGNVLVVDDNVDAANTLADGLRAHGYEVFTAYDAVQALALIRVERISSALIDLGLPVMDGLELARVLRQQFTSAQLRLIALTGYGQDSDRVKTGIAGFDAHLVKPVTLDAVHSLLTSSDERNDA
jgi:signal transduction histidine kinase/CheY-like chemotaxis protein